MSDHDRKAAVNAPQSKRCRNFLASTNRAKRLDCGVFSTALGRGCRESGSNFLQRRFRVTGTQDVRSQVLLLGYRLDPSGWKLVEQPLSILGAEDKVIDGLWVQNASATDLPKFYVTEIKLQ